MGKVSLRDVANRVPRDELLRERLLLHAVEIADVHETEPLVDAFVRELVEEPAAGDVAARRRYENDMRIDQWRRYAEHEPRARAGKLDFACECNRPGCAETVHITLEGASDRPLLAHS
jgi:hypothetical protein